MTTEDWMLVPRDGYGEPERMFVDEPASSLVLDAAAFAQGRLRAQWSGNRFGKAVANDVPLADCPPLEAARVDELLAHMTSRPPLVAYADE